jgi:peptidyl-prolyl cis-trans isomerase C
MNDRNKARLKEGLLFGGVTLAGLLVVQGFSPCKLMQRCGTTEGAESEACAKAEATSPEDVLVTVNGTAITRAEVDEELQGVLGIRIDQIPEGEREGVRRQWTPRVLEILVTRTLLEQAAEAEQVTVSEEDLAAEAERVSSELPEGITLADLKERLGLSDEEWTAELTQTAPNGKLLEAHASAGAAPSDSELEAFYAENQRSFEVPETVEARHILITTTAEDNEAARSERKQQAEALRERLVADNAPSFESVAAEESGCPSAREGGFLGSFTRGQMVPAFEDAAFNQEPGVVGPVVETPFGYHIIKVEKRTEARTRPLEEVRDTLAEQLRTEKREAAFRAYMDQLKSAASIQHADESDSA